MSGLSPQKLKELKLFLDQVKKDPQLFHLKELDFFREFMIHFGADIPASVEAKVEEVPEEPSQPEPVQEEEKEEVDPDLLPSDNDPPLEVGDESIEITDEMVDSANSLKMEGMQAHREKRFQEALDLFTKAIKSNPHSGILYASRGQVLLDMKKPNAAIRDCDLAIRISPNSAKPYKVRGRAHRFLGNYEQALKDVQTGQKLDWDDSTHAFENELKPKVEKFLAKKKKQQEKAKPKSTSSGSSSSGFPGGNPFGGGGNPFGGGIPGMDPNLMQKIMSDPEVLALLQEPETMSKLQEIMQDPSKIAQYQNDPKYAKLFAKFSGL